MQDTSRYVSRLGSKTDVVASLCSVVGRSPHPQLKTICRNPVKRLNQKHLYGYDNYDILKNLSSIIKSTAPIKQDMYTQKIFGSNNLLWCNYRMAQRTFDEKDRFKFLPRSKEEDLHMINAFKCAIEVCDEYGNVYDGININQF